MSGRNRDVLPAVQQEGYGGAADSGTKIDLPELLSGIGIEGAEDISIAREDKSTLGREDAADGPYEISSDLFRKKISLRQVRRLFVGPVYRNESSR